MLCFLLCDRLLLAGRLLLVLWVCALRLFCFPFTFGLLAFLIYESSFGRSATALYCRAPGRVSATVGRSPATTPKFFWLDPFPPQQQYTTPHGDGGILAPLVQASQQLSSLSSSCVAPPNDQGRFLLETYLSVAPEQCMLAPGCDHLHLLLSKLTKFG